jgi:hypothetical protein
MKLTESMNAFFAELPGELTGVSCLEPGAWQEPSRPRASNNTINKKSLTKMKVLNVCDGSGIRISPYTLYPYSNVTKSSAGFLRRGGARKENGEGRKQSRSPGLNFGSTYHIFFVKVAGYSKLVSGAFGVPSFDKLRTAKAGESSKHKICTFILVRLENTAGDLVLL